MRRCVKGNKHSPVKIQLNPSSYVLRAALLFRENTGRLNKLTKTPVLCAHLAVQHPAPISALPLSSLLPLYADIYFYLHLLIPILLYTDVLCSALVFPEEEADALGRCKYCVSDPLPSPPTPKNVCMHTHTCMEQYYHTFNYRY